MMMVMVVVVVIIIFSNAQVTSASCNVKAEAGQ